MQCAVNISGLSRRSQLDSQGLFMCYQRGWFREPVLPPGWKPVEDMYQEVNCSVLSRTQSPTHIRISLQNLCLTPSLNNMFAVPLAHSNSFIVLQTHKMVVMPWIMSRPLRGRCCAEDSAKIMIINSEVQKWQRQLKRSTKS